MSGRVDLLMAVAFLAVSCATPMAPSGGPQDRSGPVVVSTAPVDGSIGFNGREVRVRFNEYVDIVSFRNAVRFEPDLNIGYRIRWSGKTARIRLESPLPPNTTLVLVLSPDVKDARGNAMANPVRVAFSNGDRIDQGGIRVRLLNPETGRRAEQTDVFLYPGEVDFSTPATYTSQTDTGGYASFRYLPPDTYTMVAVQDRNRNRTWDKARESAYPWREPSVRLPADSTLMLGTWFIAPIDTVSPILEGIGQTAPDRLRLRFSKPVQAGGFRLASETDTVSAVALHAERNDRSIWFYAPESAIALNRAYRVADLHISDSLGNRSRSSGLRITFETLPDTVRQRLVDVEPKRILEPDDALSLVFAKPLATKQYQDSLRIYADRQPITDAIIRQERNRLVLSPGVPWPGGTLLTLQTFDPATGRVVRRTARVRQTGEIGDLTITAPDSISAFVVDVRTMAGVLIRRETITDRAVLSDLPAGRYLVTGFVDANRNGRFDMGSVDPHVPPESLLIERGVVIRAGFEADLRFR
jgi:uncharacterized protein (DUF2141 family)